MNEMMQGQFNSYPVSSVMILGIAGGNGIDLLSSADKLPGAELVAANLLVEYIGCKCFQNVIQQVRPKYVSCIIQINAGDSWVSDSPYLRVFDRLEQVHHQMEEHILERAMLEISYHTINVLERTLPNGKKFVQMDFEYSQREK